MGNLSERAAKAGKDVTVFALKNKWTYYLLGIAVLSGWLTNTIESWTNSQIESMNSGRSTIPYGDSGQFGSSIDTTTLQKKPTTVSEKPLLIPTPIVDSKPAGCPAIYVVKAGDTLSGIAQKFGIKDWKIIANANGVADPKKLPIGKKLQIDCISSVPLGEPTKGITGTSSLGIRIIGNADCFIKDPEHPRARQEGIDPSGKIIWQCISR